MNLSTERRTLVSATITPLASIFGSGFLIIVPVLEAGFGGTALIATALVCGVAFVVGMAVRHNIRELAANDGDQSRRAVRRLGTLSASAIALAYAVSVGLYLQIMSGYALRYLEVDTVTRERLLSTGVIVVLVIIGIVRGFGGLARLEALALGATILIITVVLAAFSVKVGSAAAGGGLHLPPAVGGGLFEQAALLGGVLITVQGFETSRYLGAEYEAEVRVRSSRLSQIIATAVYLVLVALCTPLMATATGGAADGSLLVLVERAVPLLALPLVLTGVFSQFSAAIADLVTAVGNLFELTRERLSRDIGYVFLGTIAVSVVWLFSTLALVAVASRAFAVFYAIQCVTAGLTARTKLQRAGFFTLAGAMAFVVVFAHPVG